MTASETIRDSISRINALRLEYTGNSSLCAAVRKVKAIQAQRFEETYKDLLKSKEYGPAALFFLTELYGVKDFSSRDDQFARIASAIDKIFPASVMDTALRMAQVHLMTEELDHRMAQLWLAQCEDLDDAERYLHCWRSTCTREQREAQLRGVLGLGADLIQLTPKKGLLMLLKMMRRPAQASGLGSLQSFLEQGFQTFATMNHAADGAGASRFLGDVKQRESQWIEQLFNAPEVEIANDLRSCLARVQPD